MFAVMCAKIYFFDDYAFSTKFLIGVSLAVALAVWWKTKANIILVLVSLIMGAQGADFNQIIKTYIQVNFWMLVIVTLAALIGIINNLAFSAGDRGIRYAMGSIYPTDFAARVLYLLIADAYLNFNRLSARRYVFYAATAILLKLITDARLNVICIFLLIVVMIITQHAQQLADHNQMSNWSVNLVSIYWVFTPILAVIAQFGTMLYDPNNKIYHHIDHLLSGRLTFGHMAFEKYPITWLGNRVIEHGYGNNLHLFKGGTANYFFVDSSFVRLLIVYGIVSTVFFIGVMMYISIKRTHCRDYALPAVILIVTFSSLVEQHLLEVTYDPFLLALIPTIILNLKTKGAN